MTATPTQSPFPITTKLALTTECLWQYGRVRRMVRHRPLPDVLAALRDELASHPRPTTHEVAPFRMAFIVSRVLRWLPTDTRCLMRSLTLLAMLTRRGTDATLVLGVTEAEEFGAHAWLELDGQPLLRPERPERRLVAL